MANNINGKCELKFKSRGDLFSAIWLAERLNIPFEKLGKEYEYRISIPADKLGSFKSSGAINFGLEVRES